MNSIIGISSTIIVAIAGIASTIYTFFQIFEFVRNKKEKNIIHKLEKKSCNIKSSQDIYKLFSDKFASKEMKKLMELNNFNGISIDNCVVLDQSSQFKGWNNKDILINVNNQKEIILPKELSNIVNIHRKKIEQIYINSISYRVISYKPWLSERPAQILLSPIEWYTYFTLKINFDNPILKNEKGENITIREKYSSNVLQYDDHTFPDIPTNVSIHVIAITKDRKLLITQRAYI